MFYTYYQNNRRSTENRYTVPLFLRHIFPLLSGLKWNEVECDLTDYAILEPLSNKNSVSGNN